MKFCGLKLAVLAVSCSAGLCLAAESEGAVSAGMGEHQILAATTSTTTLGVREYALAKVAAYAAQGKTTELKAALEQALAQGMTVQGRVRAYLRLLRLPTQLNRLRRAFRHRRGK